jgi:hypothetical protein
VASLLWEQLMLHNLGVDLNTRTQVQLSRILWTWVATGYASRSRAPRRSGGCSSRGQLASHLPIVRGEGREFGASATTVPTLTVVAVK